MPQLLITSLGALGFSLDGQPLDGFDYDKVRALLLLLALEPDRAHTRAALCALLWPDSPERGARASLSQALTRLRKALPAGVAETMLLADNDSVRINPAAGITLATDVHRFERALDAAEAHPHRTWKLCAHCAGLLRDAVALYRGDFLSGFSLPDSDTFEEWAQARREQLRQRALAAHERLARRAEWCGDWPAAIAHARRQTELDPLNEAGHRELMRLLALAGQGAAAQHQYEALRQRLVDELGIAPDAATQRLQARLTAREELPRDVAPESRLLQPPNALIGRDDDVAALVAQLRAGDARLLTLTGPGGVGKTRVAQQVAMTACFDYAQGVYFVALAALADAARVAPAVAAALGLRDQQADAVYAHLQRAHALLVLDNFEHVADAAPFVAGLLERCPAVTVLVTSRAALRVRAERVWPISPLALPALEAGTQLIADAPAVRLFVDRARALHPGFALTSANAADVAQISRRLDGLPLALELVATQADTLAPDELARRLVTRLPALAAGPRDLPGRQQTMSDTIRWSVDLLDAEAHAVYACAGVFAGGFTPDALQAVCGEGLAGAAAVRQLEHASLVRADSAGGGQRFVMLETVREHALQELAARDRAAGASDGAHARHAAYFAQLAYDARPHLTGPQLGRWLDRIERELDNIRDAVAWCQVHAPEQGLRMVSNLARFWVLRGNMREARAWLDALLARIDADTAQPEALAEGVRVCGFLALRLHDFTAARVCMDDALRQYQALEDEHSISLVFSNIGILEMELGNYAEAESLQRRSLALANQVGYGWNVASSLNNLAETLRLQGKFEESRACFAASVEKYRELGDLSSAMSASSNMATVLRQMGDNAGAQQRYEAALDVLAGLGDNLRLAHAILGLAQLAAYRADLDEARRRYRACISLFHMLQYEANALIAVFQLGQVEWRSGNWPAAHIVEVLGAIDEMLRMANGALDPEDQVDVESMRTRLRATLDAEAFDLAHQRGANMPLDELIRRALG